AKVKNGFKFTGPGSMATWPVNSREDNNHYSFVNHRFTIVATVTIHQVAKGSTPLLGAVLGDGAGKKIIGLSYSMNKGGRQCLTAQRQHRGARGSRGENTRWR
ncbi:trans-sialidase, partial [Trypanosoma cruzi]